MAGIKTHPTFREVAPELPEKIESLIVEDWFSEVRHRITEVGVFGSFASPYKEINADSDVDVLLVVEDWPNRYVMSVGPWLFPDWLLKSGIGMLGMAGNSRALDYGPRQEVNDLDISPEMGKALRKCVTKGGIDVAGETRRVDIGVGTPEQADEVHREAPVNRHEYAPVWRSDEGCKEYEK